MGTGHVWLNGVEITSDVDLETAEIEEQANRLNGIFDFHLRDERPVTGQPPLSIRSRDEVLVYDDAALTWGGQLALPRRRRDGAAIEYRCKAVSFDCLLDQRVIESMAGAPATPCYDDDLVDWIVSFGSALGLTTADYVSRLRTVAYTELPDLAGKTMRQALDHLGSTVGSVTYWVDPAKKVHWTSPASAQQVANADFENGATNWSLDGSAAVVDGDGAGGSGDSALTTTGDGSGMHESTQLVTGIVGNRRYLFASDLWSSVAAKAQVRLDWQTGAGASQRIDTITGTGASTWARLGSVLAAPASATQVVVRLGGVTGFTGTTRHDNVSIIGETASFGISTNPNGTTTQAYEGWEEAEDAIAPINRVLVRGTGISGWREHAGSIAYYRGKRFEATLDDERVSTSAGIDSRAAWVFARSAYPALAGKYSTRATGLQAGTWQIIEEDVLGVRSIAWLATLRTTFERGQTRYSVAYGVPEDDLGAALAAVSIAFAGSEPIVNVPESGVDMIAPAVPTGLGLSTGTSQAPDGTQRPYLLCAWAAVGDVDLDAYELQVDRAGTWTNPTTYRTGAIAQYVEDVIGGVTYYARVRALDRSGNASAWTATQSVTAGSDTSAPAIPTSLSATPGIRLVGLTWTRSAERDLAGYQVRWSRDLTGAPDPDGWARVTADLNLMIVSGLDPAVVYWFAVRAVDRSGNVRTSAGDSTAVNADANSEAGWSTAVSAQPVLVVGGTDIATGSITANRISAAGLDAGILTAGILSLGGVPNMPDVLRIYDAAGREIGRWDEAGLLVTDPDEPAKRVRIVDGTLSFSVDAGVTWTTALDGSGIRADAVTLGTAPGGHNAIPNASFELAAFTTLLSKVWTAAADWGTTIGTDVNVTKTGNDLTLTVYSYSGSGTASGSFVVAHAQGLSASGSSSQSNYRSEVLADSPAAYWRLGELAGNFIDEMVGHNAVPTGSPTRGVANTSLTGDDGAVAFPTISDYLTVADHADLDFGDGPFTVELWAKRSSDSGNWEGAVSKGAGAYHVGITTDDKWELASAETGTLFASSSAVPADGSWHHYAVTRSASGSGNTKVYVDGVDVTVELLPSITLIDTAVALRIGQGSSGGGRWTGALDEVALYPTALSSARIVAHYNAAGSPRTGWFAVSHAQAVSFDGGNAFGFPPDTTLALVSRPTIPALPTYLAPVSDPTWGTQVVRVSNVAGVRHAYSRLPGWNSDQTRILLTLGSRLLNGTTYANIKTLGSLPGNGNWSNVDPRYVYGTYDGDNKLYRLNVETEVMDTVHTFAGYYDISLGQGEGSLAADDRTMCLQAQVTSGGQQVLVSYDVVTDTIVATLNVAERADNTSVSRYGTYVLAYYQSGTSKDGPGPYKGLWVYDRDLSNGHQLLQVVRHGDSCIDTAGNEVWVQCSPAVVMTNLVTGASTTLLGSNAYWLGHVSGRNVGRDGWAYLSNYDRTNTMSLAGTDQIVAVKLDDSQTVQVFCFQNHDGDGSVYDAQSQATVSPDGKRVLFASPWGAETNSVYAYVAGLTV